MINRILPFLNKIVPISLAAKGLEKVNPKMKSFFSGALAAGYTADQAMDFLRQQFSGSEDQSSGSLRPDEEAGMNRRKFEEAPSRLAQGLGTLAAGALGGAGASALTGLGQAIPTQTQSQSLPSGIGQAIRQGQQAQPTVSPSSAAAPINPSVQAAASQTQQAQPSSPQKTQGATSAFMNFIQKHPELGNFITKEIQNGLSPIDAALTAKGQKKFKNIIEDIENKIGQSLEDIIAQLFNINLTQKSQTSPAEQAQGNAIQGASQVSNQSISDKELVNLFDSVLKM